MKVKDFRKKLEIPKKLQSYFYFGYKGNRNEEIKDEE
jgi:hypothetical protein